MNITTIGVDLAKNIFQVCGVNKAGSQALKLTLSKDGKFTGYCESSSGYTSVVNTDSSKGDLHNFSMSCSQPASHDSQRYEA